MCVCVSLLKTMIQYHSWRAASCVEGGRVRCLCQQVQLMAALFLAVLRPQGPWVQPRNEMHIDTGYIHLAAILALNTS